MLSAILNQRFYAVKQHGIEESLALRCGTRKDYLALSEHHYRAACPATFMRVLVLEHDQPTVVGRFLNRKGEKQIVGVLVESLPSLSCRLRDEATARRFASISNRKMRARALNQEMRCVSRVVVHPQWRGLGLAVKLVKHALQSATTMMTEAIAAMGKVNPFFEHAGMTPYHAVQSEVDARLIAALDRVSIAAVDLAMMDRVIARITALPIAERQFIERELNRWHQRTMLQREGDLRDHIAAARQWLLCDAVYYLKVHV